MVSQVLPENKQDLELASGLAQQQAGEALANLAVVANQLSLLLLAPISQNEPQNIDDLKPPSLAQIESDVLTPPIQTQADVDNLAPPAQDAVNITGNATTATALKTARNIDGQAFDGTLNITVIAPGTAAAASKATPVDADQLPLVDSATSNVLKKLTWANLKATLKTYFDTLYVNLTTPKVATTFGVGNATPSASGSGVSFPATQSASTDVNTLDDYEEGSWTPTSAVGSATGAAGGYTKIGNVVYFTGTLTFPVQVDAGLATIGSLPFTPTATSGYGGAAAIRYATLGSAFSLYVNSAANTIGCYDLAGNGITYTAMSGKRLDFAGHFLVA